MRRGSIILLSCMLAFSAAWADDSAPVQNVSYKSVGPQVATEGLTVQEYNIRQAELHSWLSTETPDATLANPIRVKLSREEMDEINYPDTSKPGPLKVGIVEELTSPVEVSCQPAGRGSAVSCSGDGVLQMTADGGFLWARTVTADGAAGVRVHLTGLSLPADADLYFYGRNGEAYGPYHGAGPNGDGDLWLPSVLADTGTIVVRHFGPNGRADLPQMRMAIQDIGVIGDGFFGGEPSTDAHCSYNASCVENATCGSTGPAAPAEDAAAKMLWVAGCCLNICSGGLIADSDPSTEIPLFLTANHCISKNNSASNLEAFFQYQEPCGTTSCTGSFSAPSAPKTVGSSIKATSRSGDFTLLELDQAPPVGSVYLGWDEAPVADGASLHRISHPSGAPQAYSTHDVDKSAPTCLSTSHAEFIYSVDISGATEGGSSGSPVVDASGKIVGQLTGCCPAGGGNCNDVCNGNNHTIDGALSFYFSSVEPFLDPTPCVPAAEDCTNGSDDDCDGDVDCDDADCSGHSSCQGGGGCTLGQPGDPCSSNSDCCSNKCKGPPGNQTCR